MDKARPNWLDGKSRMTGDCHVRFCESLGVRFPWATRLVGQSKNNSKYKDCSLKNEYAGDFVWQ